MLRGGGTLSELEVLIRQRVAEATRRLRQPWSWPEVVVSAPLPGPRGTRRGSDWCLDCECVFLGLAPPPVSLHL